LTWTALDENNVKEGGNILLSFSLEIANQIGYPPYKNSKKMPCQRCGQKMWVGPEQQKKREEGMYSLCERCIIEIHGIEVMMGQLKALTDKKAGE